MKVAAKDNDVKGHVPVLLLTHQFSISTSTIRNALGSTHATIGSRKLCLIVFTQFEPITELQGDELYQAWCECALCHYVLWKAGIHHRDVSCANLMRDGRMGVLHDFDLACLTPSDKPLGNERTGMILFMAIHLLQQDGQAGKVKHLYRHDMESFIWLYIWICCQYKDGKLRPIGPLDNWAQLDATQCAMQKHDFLLTAELPPGISNGKLIRKFKAFLVEEVVSRDATRVRLDAAQDSLSDEQQPAETGQLQQKIERLKVEVDEKSEDVIFTEFALMIGFDRKRIEAKVAEAVKRYSQEMQAQ
ncbi:hypothetical protein BU15DRAFT_50479 [Melanogaster broomeanus]|nr:hypothetical protein BU15DRAFT_50479 [Melanogaster broomeanus]